MSMNDLKGSMAGELPAWVRMQEKTFRRWANQFLSERMMVIEEDPSTKLGLDSQLADGIKLCTLLEVISSKSVPLGSKNPKSKFQKMENLNNALTFIKREGLVLVGIGAEDIHDGKLKLILGMIWTLILRFQINLGDGSPKWELLQWVRQQVKPYAVDEPNNFTKDWQNGKIMAALVDSIQPGIMTPHDMSGMSGDPSTDLERSFQTSLDEYEIPRILDVIDVVNEPEELSMMTYVSYFREYVNNDGRRKKEELLRKKRTADPAFCFAEGPGLEKAETYQEAHFTIHARNCFNEELDPKHGGDNFKVELKDAQGKVTHGAVKDNGDGTYPVTYVAPGAPGPLVINVTLDGTPIKDMPVTVNNQGPDAGHCRASGPGVEGGRAKHDAPFTIESLDASGARCTSGGDHFAAQVSGVGAVPLKDNGDGSFSGVYRVDKPGRVQVDITLDGKPIAHSPFDVLFELANAGQSYAEGPGLEAAQEDTPAVFTIFAVDADGARATEGGDPFKVDVKGPEGAVKVAVKDNGDGTYGVEYVPTGTGKHEVNVSLHGEPIKDMPKTVDVRATPDKSKSYIDGPFLEGVPQATKEQTFFVHAVDKHGQPIPAERDLADFAIDVAGPGGAVPIEVTPEGDALKVTFTPEQAGKYTANAKFRDAHVKNSPATVTVKPAANAANSYCEGSGLGPNVVDNETYDFTVFVVDPSGQRRTDGGDDVKVNFGSAPIPVEPTVVDNGDGTYKVTYAPEEAGEYQFNVLVEGQDVKDSPFTVKCVEGVDADNSGFGKFSCTVTARDKKGNPLTFGGATFTSEWTKPENADFDENLVDNNDGSYTIFYELRTVGKYVLVLKLNGKQIKSPIRIKID